MAAALGKSILGHVRRLLAGRETGHADRDLVERFVERRDESAFAALVERHGAMVLGVCQSVLGHHHDAEDAFQATFLVLARNARSVRRRDGIGSWLHGVAYRVALKARAARARRQALQARLAAPEPVYPADDLTWSELRSLLHAELAALPQHFREPLVLCYLRLPKPSFDDQTVLSADGKTLTLLQQDGFAHDHARVWDLERGQEVRVLPVGGQRNELSVSRRNALSPDGKLCALHTPQQVRVYDLTTGRELYQLRSGRDEVAAVVFAGTHQVVTADKKQLVQVWDARTGKRIRQFAFGPRARPIT